MRLYGSGTASRMSLDWQNLILSLGGCSRPGTVSTVSAPLVLPGLFYFLLFSSVFPFKFPFLLSFYFVLFVTIMNS